MTDLDGHEDELRFPQAVQFRIVCEAGDAPAAAVRAQAEALGLAKGLREGNVSQGGRYRSFHLDFQAESREQLRQLDAAFRGLPGVKMLL